MNRFSLILLLPLLCLWTYSCTQFEDVGSGLVDDDNLLIDKETNVDYSFETYQRDSLIAYTRLGRESDFIPTSHILAHLDDPIFGKTTYDLTTQLRFDHLGLDFEGAELDSVVFLLTYDTTFIPYGNYEQTQTLEVFELVSRDLPDVIYTDDHFDLKPGILGSHSYNADYKNQNRVDSLSIPPHIRIPLSADFGNRILALDTTVTSSVLNMLDEFPGIVVRPKEDEFHGGFRFYPYAVGSAGQANQKISDYSGIRIYYTQDEEPKQAYLKITSGLHHFTSILHDYSNSPVGEMLELNPVDPEYMFIQPAGTGIKIRFNDLSQFSGKVINDVQLKWNVAGHPMDDTTAFRPLPQIFAGIDDFGRRIPVRDILIYQASGTYRQAFGGLLLDNKSGSGSDLQYTFNITNQFQHIVDGSEDPEIFIMTTPQSVSRIARSVIYGPGIDDPQLRPSISIIYSSTKN